MRVRFWGTRGSLPKPGGETLRYGGNTACVELRSAGGTLLVLDCGTGAHDLGRALLAENPRPETGHLLISHTHWDHIQGIPFFAPLFEPEQTWHLYGPSSLGPSLHETLAGQMQYTYFPISLDQFNADVRYHDVVEGSFEVGDVRVTTRFLNHPALTLGYRLEADGVVVVYATDHEPHSSQLARGGPGMTSPDDEEHVRFLADADLLIHDAQFDASEYPERVGWGHSPAEFVVDAATLAGVRRVALFHHDPGRNDAAVDQLVERARRHAATGSSPCDVFGAAEGMELAIEASPGRKATAQPGTLPSAVAAAAPALGDQPVWIAVQDAGLAAVLKEAALADGLRVVMATEAAALLERAEAERPALVLVSRRLGDQDALLLCRELRSRHASGLGSPPIVVVAEHSGDVDLPQGRAAGVSDWLVPPFKSTYARTRMRCWLLRSACHWSPAPIPEDEAARLAALQALEVLDTPPEERFDRYTRIAAALFDVPVALVSLIDAERQWFKSHHGLDVDETPREMAFCGHAILSRDPLVVNDALQDTRFADNPLVTGPPHVRFYAGVPLALDKNIRVGSLCLIDHRPRQLEAGQLDLLRDLGGLVARELQLGDQARPA